VGGLAIQKLLVEKMYGTCNKRTMSLHVVYTFDSIKPENDRFLKLSIASVVNELGPHCQLQIHVYSTHIETVRQIVHSCLPFFAWGLVRFETYVPPLPGGTTFSNSTTNQLLESDIAHAKIFVLPELYQSVKAPLLYLDAETAIVEGSGKRLATFLMETSTVFGNIDEHCTVDQLDTYSELTTFQLRSAAADTFTLTQLRTTPVINNGVIFLPQSADTMAFLLSMSSAYLSLREARSSQSTSPFDDLVAFSIASSQSKLDSTLTTAYTNDIVHYYATKLIMPITCNEIVDYYRTQIGAKLWKVPCLRADNGSLSAVTNNLIRVGTLPLGGIVIPRLVEADISHHSIRSTAPNDDADWKVALMIKQAILLEKMQHIGTGVGVLAALKLVQSTLTVDA
jgi:hypothetical protein